MDANGNSEARIGAGSQFWLENDSGELVKIGEVTEIPFPEDVADDVEVTHFESPGRRKEYIGGLIEPGDGNLQLNWVPGSDTDTLIAGAHAARTARAYKAIVPDQAGNPEYQVEGFLIVKSRSRSVPIGDRLQMTVAVRFTGAVSEGAYSS